MPLILYYDYDSNVDVDEWDKEGLAALYQIIFKNDFLEEEISQWLNKTNTNNRCYSEDKFSYELPLSEILQLSPSSLKLVGCPFKSFRTVENAEKNYSLRDHH